MADEYLGSLRRAFSFWIHTDLFAFTHHRGVAFTHSLARFRPRLEVGPFTMPKTCCANSYALGMDYCLQCGAFLAAQDETTVLSPSRPARSKRKLWVFTAAVVVMTMLAVAVYMLQRPSTVLPTVSTVATVRPSPVYSATPSPNPSQSASPAVAYKASPKGTPIDLSDGFVDDPPARKSSSRTDPLTEITQHATPDPYLVPLPTPYTKVLYRSSEFVQRAGNWQYAFSLDRPVTLTGTVVSQEDVSIRVFQGDVPYYSVDDVKYGSINLILTRPGQYFLVVYGRSRPAGFTVNLIAHYE